jgi:ferritin
MISKNMTDALNGQINKELYSAYLYLAMAVHASDSDLPGFSTWFRMQAKEEVEHGMKIYGYVQEHGGHVELDAIEKPSAKFKSPTDLFEKALAHEQFVTKSIHALVDLAIKERDHATNSFLKWFVDEQVEEEAHASEILAKLKMIGDQPSAALLMMDTQLGKRQGED